MVIITRDIILKYYVTSITLNDKDEAQIEINQESLYKSGFTIVFHIYENVYKCIKSSRILTENYAICIDKYYPNSIISVMLNGINIPNNINIYSDNFKKYKNITYKI